MRLGIAGPISIKMLRARLSVGTELPLTREFPLIAILANEFHRRGHEVVVFALSRDVAQTQVYNGDRIQVYVCPERRPRSEMLDFWRGERVALRDAMRMANCDVIHAHWTYEFGAAAIESGLPNVITAHDNPMAVLRYARHPYWIEKPFLAWGVLKNAQCLTAVSPYVADSLHRFLRPHSDIEVVCNGVEPEVFSLFNKRSDRTSGAKLVFASALSNFRTIKNARKLIEAFSILRGYLGQRVELWMFGFEFEVGGVADLWARNHSRQAGIVFKGLVPFSELVNSLAANVDIFVHPSLEEACSMAVIEAMAMGLPVIGGQASGAVPWLLSGGKAGLLVDVTSALSIASGMRKLADDVSLRTSLAGAGRELACSRCRIGTAVDRYEDILSRAAKRFPH